MSFYAAKIVRPDGRVSRLISLFADDDAQAEQKVRDSNQFRNGDTVLVADIGNARPDEFANWGDEFGVVEHINYAYVDAGPIDAATIFESGIRKV